MGKRTQICVFTCDTDTTKVLVETSKILSWIRNCNSQKVAYLLKGRIYGEAPYVGKAKINSKILEQDLIVIKVHTGPLEKNLNVSQQRFMNNTVIMGLMISSSH